MAQDGEEEELSTGLSQADEKCRGAADVMMLAGGEPEADLVF